jgi:hypothetical protein
MNKEEAQQILAGCEDPDEPAGLPESVLSQLSIEDLPDGGVVQ